MQPNLLCRIWDDFQPRLLLIARSVATSGDVESCAEDAVQGAFIELARLAEPPADVRGWLVRVTRNRMIDFGRREGRRRRRDRLLGREIWFDATSEGSGVDSESAGELTEQLRDLPAEHRQIVVMAHWGDMSFAQIAELLSSSKSTVHRRYREAIQLLRRHVDPPAADRAASKPPTLRVTSRD
ncbi:RNA polymerase sigma factor [Planctomycetaceae bacterium SH139]